VSLFAAMLLRRFAHLRLSGTNTRDATLFVTGVFFLVGAPTLALTLAYFPPQFSPLVVAFDLQHMPASRVHGHLWPEWLLMLFLGASLANAFIVTLVLVRPGASQRADAMQSEVPDDGDNVRALIPKPLVPPLTSTRRARDLWSARQWRMPRPRTAFQWIGTLTLTPIAMTVIGAAVVSPLADCRPLPTCVASPHLAVRFFMMLHAWSTIAWPIALLWLPVAIFIRYKRKRLGKPTQRWAQDLTLADSGSRQTVQVKLRESPMQRCSCPTSSYLNRPTIPFARSRHLGEPTS